MSYQSAGMEYAFTVILFIYFLYLIIKTKKFVIGNMVVILLIYLFYNLLSLFWTPVLLTGLEGCGAPLEGYMLYYVITNSNIKFKKDYLINISKVATFVMITLTFEILTVYLRVGIDNIFFDKNLLVLGWGISNLVAVVYVFLIPIAVYKYTIKEKYFLIYFIVDLINIAGLILTLSRGAYIGLFVAMVLFLIFNLSKHLIIKYGSIVAVASALLCIYPRTFKYITLTMHKLINYDIFNDSSRLVLYKVGIKKFLDNIWFGQGVESSK